MEATGRGSLSLTRDGIIGRDDDVEYSLEHVSISRRHCEVKIEKNRVEVRDLGSRNGTWLNGRRIEQAVLAPGDTVQLGTLKFTVTQCQNGVLLQPSAEQSGAPAPPVPAGDRQVKDSATLVATQGLFNQALDSWRVRIGCQALLLFEFGRGGSVLIAESAGGEYVVSATVLAVVSRKAGPVWAPRDVPAKAASLQGCMATSIYCRPIYQREDGVIAAYAYWPFGCPQIETAEQQVVQTGEVIGTWAWERSHPPAPQEGLAEPALRTAPSMIGKSPAFVQMMEHIQKVARTDHPVILIGPPGSGKTTVAHLIHEGSRRSVKAFRRLHCAKIPATLAESELLGTRRGAFSGAQDREGLLLATDGGTLFLDSVESCPIEVQAKLLDVLEGRSFRALGSTRERSVDLRWIAATNEDPQTLMKEGKLRRDLWDRLATQVILIPPLSDRVPDIPSLAMHFLEQELAEASAFPGIRGFSPEAIRALQSYAWPGNVRELANVVKRLVTLATDEIVSEADVRRALQSAQSGEPGAAGYQDLFDLPYQEACKAFQKIYVERKLEESGQNRSEVASKIKISRKGLYKILKRVGAE
ncbi:MAG: sigma 54-interacting transcriptional regulator [Acidobacteriota bacterium]